MGKISIQTKVTKNHLTKDLLKHAMLYPWKKSMQQSTQQNFFILASHMTSSEIFLYDLSSAPISFLKI
jgi:hypothetical protein